MNKKVKLIGILLAVIVMFSCAGLTASAKDYYNSTSGNQTVDRTNVLYYKDPHGNFMLRVYAVAAWNDTNKYSISMYDNAGRCVWGATNQGDRTYTIGGNVTKIVITKASMFSTIYWQKK